MADEQSPNHSEATPESYDLENGPLKESVDKLMGRLGLSPDTVTEDVPTDAPLSEGEPDVPSPGKSSPEAVDDGTTIDWSKFELDPGLEHLYHKSQPMELPDGTTGFVTPWAEFKTISKPVNTAGEYISQMVNGAEQWQLSALLPNGAGLMAIIFQRTTRRLLPHPTLLQTETKVEMPKDEELQQTEDAALSWAGQSTAAEEAAQVAAEALDGPDFGHVSTQQEPDVSTAVEGADVE